MRELSLCNNSSKSGPVWRQKNRQVDIMLSRSSYSDGQWEPPDLESMQRVRQNWLLQDFTCEKENTKLYTFLWNIEWNHTAVETTIEHFLGAKHAHALEDTKK